MKWLKRGVNGSPVNVEMIPLTSAAEHGTDWPTVIEEEVSTAKRQIGHNANLRVVPTVEVDHGIIPVLVR